MTRLLIARHGNTFGPNDTPVRIGARTDLPLSESGCQQANRLGIYLKKNHANLSVIFTSELKRTQQMAEIAIEVAQFAVEAKQLAIFNEIDYGPDEAKTEEEVIARIGQTAIDNWNQCAKVPAGWQVNPDEIIHHWQQFADQILTNYPTQTILVITSNGIARFAPHLLNDIKQFSKDYPLKMVTGAISEFYHFQDKWQLDRWNYKPDHDNL